MNRAALLAVVLAACSSSPAPARPGDDGMDPQVAKMMTSMDMPADDGSSYGPLGVGAEYAGWVQMNTAPVRSETHGGRLVDTYVNPIGAAAYLDPDAAMPVGTVIVKTSMEDDGSAGPTFVMDKRAPGFDAEHGDWGYAIHWAAPPARWAKKLGGPIYWRSPSHRVGYCVECHDNYDRNLGDVPGDAKITALPAR